MVRTAGCVTQTHCWSQCWASQPLCTSTSRDLQRTSAARVQSWAQLSIPANAPQPAPGVMADVDTFLFRSRRCVLENPAKLGTEALRVSIQRVARRAVAMLEAHPGAALRSWATWYVPGPTVAGVALGASLFRSARVSSDMAGG